MATNTRKDIQHHETIKEMEIRTAMATRMAIIKKKIITSDDEDMGKLELSKTADRIAKLWSHFEKQCSSCLKSKAVTIWTSISPKCIYKRNKVVKSTQKLVLAFS